MSVLRLDRSVLLLALLLSSACASRQGASTSAAPTALSSESAHSATPSSLHSAEHARQHAATAEELEHFEERECAGIPSRERGACPVLSSSAIKVLPSGIRVHVADPDQIDATVRLMRCHLAYARARGFERVAECPLYLRGVEIELSADGDAVELTSSDPEVAQEIMRRAFQLLGR
jgi:hypothetical protein